MTLLQAFILGIIQGITEFLPISSSAHLVLASKLFGWEIQPSAFDIMVHGATLCVIAIYFKKDLISLTKATKSKASQKLLVNLIAASIPVCITGFLLKDFIDKYFKDIRIIAFMLISIGIPMLFVNKICHKNTKVTTDISIKDSLIIGTYQITALIRGVSRSGITSLAGLTRGLERQSAAKFALLAGMLPILGAWMMQLIQFSSSSSDNLAPICLIIGFLSSFVSGMLAVKVFFAILQKRGFLIFGIYRIIIGMIVLLTTI